MEQAEFVRSAADRLTHFFWFLGAGTSQSAGLPTAVDVIWDLKRRYYASEENRTVSTHDMQNPAVRENVQSYMLSKGFPESGAPEEYSTYFDLIFKRDMARQQRYIHAMLSDDRVSLSLGHRVLGALLASKVSRAVFTTNFDNVVEKAVAEVSGTALAAFHLEGSYAANAALNNEQFPILCKLHGDFRYQSLKNLTDDLKSQNTELGKCLTNAIGRYGMIVAGYSGRDASVMELFSSALAGPNPFAHGIYWTVLRNRPVLPAVKEFMDAARTKGITAEIIEVDTFDSIMSRLWKQLPDRDTALDAKVRRAAIQAVAIPIPGIGKKPPIVRMNALPITVLPSQCLRLSFNKPKEWDDIHAAEAKAGDAMIAIKGEGILAWGMESAIHAAFGPDLISLEPVSIAQQVAALDENTVMKSFVEKALCHALKRDRPLLHRTSKRRSYLIAGGWPDAEPKLAKLSKAVSGGTHGKTTLFTKPSAEHPAREPIAWSEAVEVRLEVREGRYWVLLQPDVWIWPKYGREDAVEFLDRRKEKRFNPAADEILSAWIDILFPDGSKNQSFDISPFVEGSAAENPMFSLGNRSAFSRGAA